ncbi:MAG: glycosyltransferase family 4 protein [Dehalococcoidia bacterium]
MSRLRVLAFSDVALPEGSGGVERQIEEVYGRWVAAGDAEVLLVALGDQSLPRRDVRRGVRIVRASQLNLGRLTGMQATLSWGVWPLAFKAARVFRPDVVHAHTLFYASSPAAAAIARREDLPLALTAHIGSLDALPGPQRAASRLYESTIGRALVRQADVTICVGESVRRHIEGLGGREPHLRVVPNGVDRGRFHPGPRQLIERERGAGEPLIIVSAGRLIFNKGHHAVIDAVRALDEDGLPVELRIAGDGPMRDELEQRAADLTARGVVTFLGQRDDIEDVVRDADVFVRASMTESMPMGVLEGMATGLAVVASDVGSTREIVEDGRTGLLVRPEQPVDLVEALRCLASDAALRRELGRNAREATERFSWDASAAGTLEAVHEAVRLHRARSAASEPVR